MDLFFQSVMFSCIDVLMCYVLPPAKKWKFISSLKQGNISAKMQAAEYGICTEHVFIVITVAPCSASRAMYSSTMSAIPL